MYFASRNAVSLFSFLSALIYAGCPNCNPVVAIPMKGELLLILIRRFAIRFNWKGRDNGFCYADRGI